MEQETLCVVTIAMICSALASLHKIYVHEIAAVNLSKIYFLKNAKRICKPMNRVLNRN